MCGGCGWDKGEYACTTWVADAVRSGSGSDTAAGGAAAAAQLAEALQRSGLQVVELAMGGIDGPSCARLAEALRGNSTVRELDLGWNTVGDGGAKALASMLPHTALSSLDLRANDISDAAADELGTGVAATASLVELRLGGNPRLSPDAIERLGGAVAANCARTLCLTCGEVGHPMGSDDCKLLGDSAAAATAADSGVATLAGALLGAPPGGPLGAGGPPPPPAGGFATGAKPPPVGSFATSAVGGFALR